MIRKHTGFEAETAAYSLVLGSLEYATYEFRDITYDQISITAFKTERVASDIGHRSVSYRGVEYKLTLSSLIRSVSY